jgi:hypothetical protein
LRATLSALVALSALSGPIALSSLRTLLAGLTVAAQRTGLVILSTLILIALAWLTGISLPPIPAAQRLDLTTQPLDVVESGLRVRSWLLLTACHERLLRLAHLIAQTLQAGGDLRFRAVAVRIDAAAKPVGRPLQARFEVALVQALERLSQLTGHCALTGIELARGVSHVLLKVRKVVGHALSIVGELLDVAPDRSISRTPLELADAIGLALFLGGQTIGLLRNRAETSGGDLRLHPTQQTARLAEAFGGQTRVGRRTRIGCGTPHLFLRLSQTIQRLLRRLLRGPPARVSGRLALRTLRTLGTL